MQGLRDECNGRQTSPTCRRRAMPAGSRGRILKRDAHIEKGMTETRRFDPKRPCCSSRRRHAGRRLAIGSHHWPTRMAEQTRNRAAVLEKLAASKRATLAARLIARHCGASGTGQEKLIHALENASTLLLRCVDIIRLGMDLAAARARPAGSDTNGAPAARRAAGGLARQTPAS
ncbi:hypothetical protein [Burkholderia plantarii]|uniref:hypothetical protein n=1 Tax=Burkholderia plantarii TaxID=41899 RepID=UPI0018DB71D3|nr:hypothetical protein [Burkholderia plantarii]MBI0330259.1 hypothetical protein [Burkholderia plantarii]